MAGGRHYVDVQTIGNIEIYQVTSNPNGQLPARAGSLAIQQPPAGDDVITWQNTNGGTAWKMTSEKSSRGIIGTTPSVNQVTLLPPGPVPFQVQIPVFFDMTLKQLLITSMGANPTNPGYDCPGGYRDYTGAFIITSITVDAGPDIGIDLAQGVVPARIFSTNTPNLGPELNLRCPAGSTVTITCLNLTSNYSLPADFACSFTSGIDPAQDPNLLIGASFPGTIMAASTGNAAGAFNVIGAPIVAGEYVAWGRPDDSPSMVLTANAGPRVSGNDNFDGTLGTPNAIRNDMFNAISDPANSFGNYTPINSGTTGLIIQWNSVGLFGNRNSLWSNSPNINVINSTFLGGTGVITPAVFATVARDLRLHRFYLETYMGAGAPGSQYIYPQNLVINGVPNPSVLNQFNGYSMGPKFPGNNVPIDQFVPAGAGITLDLMNTLGSTGFAFPCFLAVPASP